MVNFLTTIEEIKARQIFDSRGIPTIETEVILSNGIVASASVPSGASTGSREALELRDNDKNNYFSKGVGRAIENVNDVIAPILKGMVPFNQEKIDNILIETDGTNNMSNLGANAVLSVSSAVLCAGARAKKQPLFKYIGGISAKTIPTPMINIINGGAHSNNNLDFQEFMIVPDGFSTFKEKIKAASEVFHKLKDILCCEGYSTNVGDEGGFAPSIKCTKEAIELILKAIDKCGYLGKISLALDVASSEFYSSNYYDLRGEEKVLSTQEMIEYLETLTKQYPIISIEDGMAENDFDGWVEITSRFKNKNIMLVGDDLFTTNPRVLAKGIENDMANSILIKPNQIGTISKTIECVILAKKYGYTPIISHRSGETCSSLIADIGVGLNMPYIKAGSISRGERLAKYNRLLKIEDMLNS